MKRKKLNHDYHPLMLLYAVLLSRSRLKSSGSRLLPCDLRVLWWQSCGNSYIFSQMLPFFTQIKRKNRCTFKQAKLFYFIFHMGRSRSRGRLHNTGCTGMYCCVLRTQITFLLASVMYLI